MSINSIDSLYTAYSSYDASYNDLQKCIQGINATYPNPTPAQLATYYSTYSCPGSNLTPLTYYNNLLNQAQTIETSSRNLMGQMTDANANDFNNRISVLDASYNHVLQKRSDLDEKMNELLYGQNSISREKMNISDASVITTLLWTVMATSLLYIVFVKL